MPKTQGKNVEKMFAVRDNQTGKVARLVQASKKSDVIKHLAAAFTVDELGAVDATALVVSGMTVERAVGSTESPRPDGAPAGDGSDSSAGAAVG